MKYGSRLVLIFLLGVVLSFFFTAMLWGAFVGLSIAIMSLCVALIGYLVLSIRKLLIADQKRHAFSLAIISGAVALLAVMILRGNNAWPTHIQVAGSDLWTFVLTEAAFWIFNGLFYIWLGFAIGLFVGTKDKSVLILCAIAVPFALSGLLKDAQSRRLLPHSEVVLKPGMSVTATNPNGTVTIVAGEGTARTFKGDGWQKTKKLTVRQERWIRQLGLYSPVGDIMAEESRLHFSTVSEALRYLYVGSDLTKPVYTNNGLVFGYSASSKHIELHQIYINGKRPTAMPGADDSAISLSGGTIQEESTPYSGPSGPAGYDGLGKDEYRPEKFR